MTALELAKLRALLAEVENLNCRPDPTRLGQLNAAAYSLRLSLDRILKDVELPVLRLAA